ncbi:O-antigen ligase family protein [Pontibacter litorisediminis]|uniref:O-antigen ligase family protein n=1 Tax=Pontibacter litorisediminis TaxID=1846260 RepID=UPI0023ED525E|nr:O-antigen ligase family protein [Pontibacter litorisediminis]
MLGKRSLSIYLGTGLAALVAALPFSIKITSILSILLLLLWVLEADWQKKWETIKTERWVQLFVGFYMLHVLGLLYTQNLGDGLFDLEKKLSLVLFPLILGTSPAVRESQSLRDKVHSWFIFFCLLALLYCLGHGVYRFIAGIPPSFSVYGGFEATQQFLDTNKGVSALWNYITYSELLSPLQLHPTYSSLFILLVIVILLEQKPQVGYFERKQLGRLLLLLFFTLTIFLIASRIAVAILILLLPIKLFMRMRGRVSWKKLAMASSVCILLLALVINFVPVVKHRFINDFQFIGQTYDSQNPGTGMMMRLTFWKTAAEVIMENPVIGVGTGDVQDAMAEIYRANGVSELAGYNPHNQYLHTAAMLGLIGSAYLLAMLLLPLILAWKRRDNVYLFFLLIVGITFFTESVLQSNKGIVFYALFNSLYLFNFPPYSRAQQEKVDRTLAEEASARQER